MQEKQLGFYLTANVPETQESLFVREQEITIHRNYISQA